jgi:hypothetical protein
MRYATSRSKKESEHHPKVKLLMEHKTYNGEWKDDNVGEDSNKKKLVDCNMNISSLEEIIESPRVKEL